MFLTKLIMAHKDQNYSPFLEILQLIVVQEEALQLQLTLVLVGAAAAEAYLVEALEALMDSQSLPIYTELAVADRHGKVY